ncbi:MAG: GNAT family N-acetyltransferase [Bosea sp. (in: a-proteobacteria)]
MPLLTFIGATTWVERSPLPDGAGALSLHPFTPVDIGLVEQWLAEPHLARFWLTGPGDHATKLERHRSRFIEAMEIAWLAPFTLRLRDDGGTDSEPQRIGAVFLRHVNAMPYWRSHAIARETIGIDLFIGEAGLMGRGHGKRAIRLAAQAAFSDQEVKALMADPDPRNQSAIAAFKAAGFEDSGHAVTPAGAVSILKLPRPERP